MSIKQVIYLSILLFSKIIFAQSSIKEIEILLSNEQIKEANSLIVKELKNKPDNPKLWFYKGIIIQQKIELSTIPYRKKEILDSAYYCFKQALRYDDRKMLESALSENLLAVSQQYTYTGLELFNNKEYNNALEVFEKGILISGLPVVNHLDTMAFYSAAMSAEKAEDLDKAKYFYKEIIKFYPTDWNSIVALADIYKLQGNNEKYLEIIKLSNVKYPEIEIFYNELVAYFLETKEVDSAMLYLDKVIRISNNYKLYYLKASILQEQGKVQEAKTFYYKCLELNPSYADALYNLSAIAYNQVLDLLGKPDKTKKEVDLLEQSLKESVKYLVLVKQLEPNNRNVLLMLKTCYHELGNKEEEDIIVKELEQFPN